MTHKTVPDYYKHVRGLAPFRAVDALKLAKEAAALDHAAAVAKMPPPGAACWEFQAGELPIRLSFSIKVF